MGSLEPAAFLSYVRADDQHEGGLISQFRERLSAEVRMQIGQDFPIFQDRNDIAWGQNWQARIDETLDTDAVHGQARRAETVLAFVY